MANLLRRAFAAPAAGRGSPSSSARTTRSTSSRSVFREAGIPAVLDGGVSFYRREETAAVVAALRAVDDPSDGIATVAALKSFLFGLTDVELLDAAESGARLDDPATRAGPWARRRSALVPLLAPRAPARAPSRRDAPRPPRRAPRLRRRRNGAVVNPLQAAANLERLLVLARALDAEGLPFREAVSRLASRLEGGPAEPRAFEEKDDAVRLLTLHKSKGLEFDIVVVAEPRLPRPRRPPAAPDASSTSGAGGDARAPGLRRRSPRRDARPPLRRRTGRAAASAPRRRRLLYVALTRAKKTLVLSWFRRRRS